MIAKPSEIAGQVTQHLGLANDTGYFWLQGKNLPEHKNGRFANPSSSKSMNGSSGQIVPMEMRTNKDKKT